MKALLFVLLGVACGVGVWLVVELGTTSTEPASSGALRGPSGDDARVAALEAKIVELERDVDRLAFRVAQAEGSPREAAGPKLVASGVSERSAAAAVDPRAFLREYVMSFAAGGEGSEYFRLAVDAYASELAAEICDIVRDEGSNPLLRGRLAAMLGTLRFRGNLPAIDALLAALRGAQSAALALTALDALKVIGDAQTSLALERVVWSLDVSAQQRALATIVQLAGAHSERALGALFASAPGDAQRALVLGLLTASDAQGALDVLKQASTAAVGLRLIAARTIARFHGQEFAAFIDVWLGYETDPQVRQQLGSAREQVKQVRAYSPQKAVGPPDAIAGADHPNAWASLGADMGVQTLDLSYSPPRRASAVRIFEVCVAGALTEVVCFDENGASHSVWSGVDPTTVPGVFEVAFATTSYRVKSVRLVLDTNRSPGWSEIDAVELVGPEGAAFASQASASSWYGQSR